MQQKIRNLPYIGKYMKRSNVFAVAALVYVALLSPNDWISQRKLIRQRKELEKECKYYKSEIEKNRNAINLLDHNLEHLEKIAREKFLMKRDNEEIFIFVED